jgi:hypothetical protein
MNAGLADRPESVAPIKRADRIPLQIFKPHRKSGSVGQCQRMGKDLRSEPATPMRLEQIEFSKTEMVGVRLPRERADRNIAATDRKERFFSEAEAMDSPLIFFVPKPTRANMRTKSFFLDRKGKFKRRLAVRQRLEPDVRRQFRQATITNVV